MLTRSKAKFNWKQSLIIPFFPHFKELTIIIVPEFQRKQTFLCCKMYSQDTVSLAEPIQRNTILFGSLIKIG